MSCITCKLNPKGPFHLGTKETVLEGTAEYVHSDTLFSAICNTYRLLYGNTQLENLLQLFKVHQPPFLISSAFPRANDILLFPIPKNVDLGDFAEDRKKFKNVAFISKTIFDQIIAGTAIGEHVQEENLVQNGRVLLTNTDIESFKRQVSALENGLKIWTRKEVPRVVIDRTTSASEIYHFGEVSYSKGCGLFFLLKFERNAKYEREIKATMRLLGDTGIGGDRTSGKGLFKIQKPEFEPIEIDFTPRDCFTTLSLYYPTRDELKLLKNGRYELIGRGGWIYSPADRNMRRKFVRMFVEGSVFQTQNGLYGDLVPVTPEAFTRHEVFRYGYAFSVPMEARR